MTRWAPRPPADGEEIGYRDGYLEVPDRPIVPFIAGDGIGPEITQATQLVLDRAIERAYDGSRSIAWMEILAGERAAERTGDYLPAETIQSVRHYRVAIKGPLTTPVGGGFASINASLRQQLELYANVRPVRHFRGVPSPVTTADQVDMVVFRENTEDVYAGIEWPSGSAEARELIEFVRTRFGSRLADDSGVGLKPMTPEGSKRLVRKALRYCLAQRRFDLTLVHKGNIMKYTEGAFRNWGYEVAADEFPESTVTESELWGRYSGTLPEGRILVKDRMADAMFQQILLRPSEYNVIATTNLNGDYLSDALAAQVGGLGMAPGSNEGDGIFLFEATHGSAPRYAGRDKVNPGSLILSGTMMLRALGWREAADAVEDALERTILEKRVTYDLARQLEGATELGTSDFAYAIVENLS